MSRRVKNPAWCDGAVHVGREVDGAERDQWWERAVAAFAPHADYQARTERRIPVFIASRA